MSGEVPTPFRGYFDGCGNTITGLKIAGELDGKTNLGLFGVIDGGSVENLEIQCDQVRGLDQVGILAGAVKNGAVIRNVRVSGYVYSRHNAALWRERSFRSRMDRSLWRIAGQRGFP